MAVVVGTAQGKLTLNASSFVSELDKSYKALKSLNDLVSDTQKRLKDLSNTDVNVKANADTSGLSGFDPGSGQDAMKGIGEEAEKSAGKVGILKEALNVGLTGALKGVGTLAKVTFEAFEKYTKFVIGFGKDSLATGQQFDATMSQVSAIAGATGDDFDVLRNRALEMGAQTKFSAQEAAQAMVYMGMAGWETQDIYDGVTGVMSLAAASGEDLATTSDIVTDALTALGLTAKDTAHFADTLAAASTNSNTNVALMGESFKYVAPLAGTLKFSAEDVAVALGTMANSGIKGSQAGTALRTTLTNLLKPSKQVQEAMNAFGISMQDDEGNALDLMGTMEMLRKKLSDIPEVTAEEASALKDAAGQIEMYREHKKDFLSAFDTEEDANAAFQAALDTVAQIGSVYGKTEDEMLAMSNYLGASLEQTQATVAATIAGKYGLSGMLAIVNSTDEDFQKLTNSIYASSTGLESITNAIQNSGVAWENYLDKAWATESGMQTIAADITHQIQGLGKSTEEVQEHLQLEYGISADDALKVIQSIQSSFAESTGAAEGMSETMMDNLQGSITIFQSTLEGFKISVGDILKEPANNIVKFGQQSLADMTLALQRDGIPGLIRTIGSIIPKAAKEIVKLIPEILPSLIDGFWALVNGLIDSLPEAFPILVDAAFDLFVGLIDGLDKAVIKLVDMLPELVSKLCTRLTDDAPKILNTAIDLFLNLVEGIAKAAPDIIKAAAKLIPQIVKSITKNFNKIIQVGIDLIIALVEGLTDPETIEALLVAVAELCDFLINGFMEVDWLTVCDKIFSGIGKALLGIFEGAMLAIDDLLGTNFGDWAKEVTQFFTELKQASFDFGKSLAMSMNKTEDELNKLQGEYAYNYQAMLEMYANLVKQGVNAQEAMAAAYQQYFTSAEAQYVFRERFAQNLVGTNGAGGLTGWSGTSTNELMDIIGRATTVSGNTYNFYSPEPIDEKKAADEMKQTSEEILRGY